jgi:hypothetical protein
VVVLVVVEFLHYLLEQVVEQEQVDILHQLLLFHRVLTLL